MENKEHASEKLRVKRYRLVKRLESLETTSGPLCGAIGENINLTEDEGGKEEGYSCRDLSLRVSATAVVPEAVTGKEEGMVCTLRRCAEITRSCNMIKG